MFDRVHNVQTRTLGPRWSRGLPVTIAGGLVSTFILAAWEVALPADVVAASPIVLLVCAGAMVSSLWLPKSLGTASRTVIAVEVGGAALIYGLGAARALPAVLFAAALAYPGIGFARGRRLVDTPRSVPYHKGPEPGR